MAKNDMEWYDWALIALVTAGGINWGLIGFFGFDLVRTLAGNYAAYVYDAVGIASVISIALLIKGD